MDRSAVGVFASSIMPDAQKPPLGDSFAATFTRKAYDSMNKRSISRLMQERINGLKDSNGYFFRADFEHVLRGVLFEYVPRGVYIWNVHFPLFDPFGENLLYSNRLHQRAFFGKDELSDEALVDAVMAQPEARTALRAGASMSLSEFLSYLRGSDALLNEHAQLVFAAGLVLDGDDSQAVRILDEIQPRLSSRDSEHCRRLRTALNEGHDAAINLLGDVRSMNLNAFGLA